MAWSVGRATWVAALSDPEIAQQVGTRTFDRGVAYAAEARVRSIATRPDGLVSRPGAAQDPNPSKLPKTTGNLLFVFPRSPS